MITVRAGRNDYERCHFITQRSANVTQCLLATAVVSTPDVTFIVLPIFHAKGPLIVSTWKKLFQIIIIAEL